MCQAHVSVVLHIFKASLSNKAKKKHTHFHMRICTTYCCTYPHPSVSICVASFFFIQLISLVCGISVRFLVGAAALCRVFSCCIPQLFNNNEDMLGYDFPMNLPDMMTDDQQQLLHQQQQQHVQSLLQQQQQQQQQQHQSGGSNNSSDKSGSSSSPTPGT